MVPYEKITQKSANTSAHSHKTSFTVHRTIAVLRFARQESDDLLDDFWMIFQWIGLRENLQETIDFPIKYGVFL
jgi:hypothetical protein